MSRLLPLMEATWPAAETRICGPFVLRRGLGGGSRVSAASRRGPWSPSDLTRAEAAMRALGQNPLFMLTPAQTALDRELARRSYALTDRVVLLAANCAAFGPAPPGMTAQWPPGAGAIALWQAGGIGPQRLAVMQRAGGPKAALVAQEAGRPCGVAFAALSGPVVFVHALHVAPEQRRRGIGRGLMRAAAEFGARHGARRLGLAVTLANREALALYAALGMAPAGHYHYRQLPA